MKLIIVGGVAGGASAAAKARRLSEDSKIIIFERGEYVSFANCGLPYHIGKVIQERDDLIVMTPEKLKNRANIDVRIKQEVISINRKEKTVKVKDMTDNRIYEENYDKLILSTGSSPIRPPVPGADNPDIDILWTIPDMDKIIKKIDNKIKNAVVVGGGFIGLELVENLIRRGLDVTLIEMLPQILPPFDREMTQPLQNSLTKHGVKLYLDNAVSKVEQLTDKEGFTITLKSGKTLDTDMLVLAAGVRPNSELAKASGLELNSRNGIVVNNNLQTNDPDIYAIGDVIQVNDQVLNSPAMIPLAGPANKQGRIAAKNIFGSKSIYEGSLGTAICKLFDLCAASTGTNEKRLKQVGVEYNKFYIVPNSNASYYPGASEMYIKILHNVKGNILGAQIVGEKGVDKRIDILATAIKHKFTFSDLEELELAYAPPYGSAKDPINFIGYVGNNILNGDSEIITADSIPEQAYLIDVRDPDEVISGTIPGSVNIPLGKLRDKLNEIPADREIVVFCKMGLRGYLAEKILRQKGFNAKNLSGGVSTWKLFNPDCAIECSIV